jgi:hypothetical protein
MSKQKSPAEPGQDNEPLGDHIQPGPNLILIYGLMLFALLIAIGLATLVVWPFYQHRH